MTCSRQQSWGLYRSYALTCNEPTYRVAALSAEGVIGRFRTYLGNLCTPTVPCRGANRS